MDGKRKPLSKKLRFDVFKRDGFICGYCGRRPPEAILEVDHITPVCDGGKNRMVNLITSCFDCNRGKGGTPINKNTHQEAALALKEKRNQLKAYNKLVEGIEAEQESQVDMVQDVFMECFNRSLSNSGRRSVKTFIKNLGTIKVKDAAEMAVDRRGDSELAFKYMCGICWNWIKGYEYE